MSAFSRDPTLELSGEWHFLTDPDDAGIHEEWYSPDTTFPTARDVLVPHVWQSHDNLREYTGTAWYRRTFAFDPDAERRQLLQFGAVDYEATVWVNGTQVGTNHGGYLPFEFDVTEHLQTGENVVAVRVHDPADLREIPHGKQGYPWYTRVSGIWQDVSLVDVPEIRVASVRATPDLDVDAVHLSVDIANSADDNVRAHVIVQQDGRTLGSAEEVPVDGTVDVTVDLSNPTYWSPETPALCDIEVKLVAGGEVVDSYTDYFGMRQITVDDGDWYLNGELLRVRGALDQAYYPDTHFWPSGHLSYREEIEGAKELGFNMLRKHIKPAHPEFVELADRLGLLVWEEPANPDLYTERSKREVRDQFEGLVERDYNRPSVVAWSLYNEEWGIGIDQHDYPKRSDPTRLWNDEEKQKYLAEFYEDARKLDPTRLVCDNSGWAHVATDINDYHEYFVLPDRADSWDERLADVVKDPAENYATTTYGPSAEDVPLVVSEFGTWGLPSISSLTDYYGGNPPWFDHEFLDGLKRPAGVGDRFADSHLSDVYDGLDSLAADWQRREFESVAELIADMRTHQEVSGYVITEFTDIEWEFNGVLDYLRRDKSFATRLTAINGPTMVRVEPGNRVVRAGETIDIDFALVNDRTEPLETTLRWTASTEGGTLDVAVDAGGITRLDDVVQLVAPDTDGVDVVDLHAQLADTDAEWTASVTVVGDHAPTPQVYADSELVSQALSKAEVEPVDSFEDADVAVTTEVGTDERAFAAEGGRLVVLPDTSGRLDEGICDHFDLRTLSSSESWNLCASFLSQTMFDELDRVPGWAFQNLYPYSYVTDISDEDEVHVGYTEGWLSATGGAVVTRPYKNGELTVCGLRIADSIDEQPIAAAALRRLLAGRLDSH